MRSRQTGKQAAAGDGESRGKRKLDFAASSTSKPAQPLQGKVFYLDLHGYGALNIKKLESNIVLLGGSVVNFFDKDVGVTHVISNQDGAKKDTPSGVADSPAASTPSPFSAATSVRRSSRGNLQSPAVDSPSNPGSSSAVSRGKAIARKAMDTQKQGSSNVLSIAKQLKLKIKHIDVAAQWIEEQASKLKKAGVKAPQKAAQNSGNTSKARKLKSPFLKFEDSSHQYRPVYEELPKFPRVTLNTPRGTCPFDGGTYQDVPVAERSKEEMSQAEEGGDGGTGKKSEQRKEENVPKPSPKKRSVQRTANKKAATSQSRSKASALKVKKNAGYCECCMLKYSDLQQHIKGEQHRAFVRREENYSLLDKRIRTGPVLDRFLKDVMKYHPIDKTRALQSSGWPEDPEEPEKRSDEVVLISDPVPEPVVPTLRWPTPAMRKVGMNAPSVISSIQSMSQHNRPTLQGKASSSTASSLQNLSNDEEEEEERRKRKHQKKMEKVTTPQKVFGSSPEKRFPALDRLVQSVESKLEKRKSSDHGSQCSATKRQKLEFSSDGADMRQEKRTERAEGSSKPAQKSLNRLLEEEESSGGQHREGTASRFEHSLPVPKLNFEESTAQDKVCKPSNKPSPVNFKPRRSPRERNVNIPEKAKEEVEQLSQQVRRSARKNKQKPARYESDVSQHKEPASDRLVEKEQVKSTVPVTTPEKRHSLVEIQTTPIRASDDLERRQRELVRSPSPVISPETRQSLPKDTTTSVLGSSINTSTPLGRRTQTHRTDTAGTSKEKSLPQRPRASSQPKIKPPQESTKREPGRKALRKTKHLENASDSSVSVHKPDVNTQGMDSDQCAALFLSSDPASEFLGFDLTVSEADRIWQQASGVDLSRRALLDGSSDKSETFEIDMAAFQSEGSDWDKPVTGFISAELSRKVSVNTVILSPRDSDKENQDEHVRQRLKSVQSTFTQSSGKKDFFTTDLSGNLLSDVRLRRLELERRISQGKLSHTRSFCEIAGLPPMPEPPPTPQEPPPPPGEEKNVAVAKAPEARVPKGDDTPAPLDLLDQIDQPQVQPSPSKVASKGKRLKNVAEDVVGVEDVQSVGWSDCGKEEEADFFRVRVRNPQTNELHNLKAAKPLQLENPFYIMSEPTTRADQSGKKETGVISPGVSPQAKLKYKPSPKKVLNYRSRQVLPKSPVKNTYSRPVTDVPESAVRKIMDDLGFQQGSSCPEESYGYMGTPHANRRLSDVELRDVEYEQLIEEVINSPRWVSESQLGPQSSETMTSNVDALDLLDDWNTLISEEVETSETLPSSGPTESQETATSEGNAETGSAENSDPSDVSIWDKLEKWVSEGSSDVPTADGDRPSKDAEKPDNAVSSPAAVATTKTQQRKKQPSKSPRRTAKSQQSKQNPSKSQAKPNSKPKGDSSKKSSKMTPSKKKGVPAGIQRLTEKYRRRPLGPSHHKSSMGRYRKIMRHPIRREQQPNRTREPVRKKPTKKPTRRSPRVILHRLNLKTVQTTPAGDILVKPVPRTTTENQTAQQVTQKKRRQVKKKKGRPPKQAENTQGTQRSPGGRKPAGTGTTVSAAPSVLNGRNLDVPSSPDAVSSPQQTPPKRKLSAMDSPDRWTSPRTSPRKKPALYQGAQEHATPSGASGRKKKTTSPGVRRGRPLKTRIPEGRNK